MTRARLQRSLRTVWVISAALVVIACIARFVPDSRYAAAIYDIIKDMSLLIFTVFATYLANTLQKRENFVEALREEWHDIITTKSALIRYCEHPSPTELDYIATFCRLSETIDNMRIVYKNVGETDELIGLYPYAPLHNMRRALQSIDPRKTGPVDLSERKKTRDLILESFYALRESFLEELDLEAPTTPILMHLSRRSKKSGAEPWALGIQKRESREQAKMDPYSAEMQDVIARIQAIEDREKASERR